MHPRARTVMIHYIYVFPQRGVLCPVATESINKPNNYYMGLLSAIGGTYNLYCPHT
jgi:hypothetical protein